VAAFAAELQSGQHAGGRAVAAFAAAPQSGQHRGYEAAAARVALGVAAAAAYEHSGTQLGSVAASGCAVGSTVEFVAATSVAAEQSGQQSGQSTACSWMVSCVSCDANQSPEPTASARTTIPAIHWIHRGMRRRCGGGGVWRGDGARGFVTLSGSTRWRVLGMIFTSFSFEYPLTACNSLEVGWCLHG
jgi:hypothetical protein